MDSAFAEQLRTASDLVVNLGFKVTIIALIASGTVMVIAAINCIPRR